MLWGGGHPAALPSPALPQGEGCASLGGMRAPRRVLRDGGRQRELGLVGRTRSLRNYVPAEGEKARRLESPAMWPSWECMSAPIFPRLPMHLGCAIWYEAAGSQETSHAFGQHIS